MLHKSCLIASGSEWFWLKLKVVGGRCTYLRKREVAESLECLFFDGFRKNFGVGSKDLSKCCFGDRRPSFESQIVEGFLSAREPGLPFVMKTARLSGGQKVGR